MESQDLLDSAEISELPEPLDFQDAPEALDVSESLDGLLMVPPEWLENQERTEPQEFLDAAEREEILV